MTLVNFSQIVDHAQTLSMLASLVCGGFAAYMLAKYHRFYGGTNQLLLCSIVILALACLEGLQHMSDMISEHTLHVTVMSCIISLAMGIFMLLLTVNHDRLISAVRGEFTETTSVVKTEKLTHLTRTQQVKMVESSDYKDILDTLNLMTSCGTKRLLRVMKFTGWSLVAFNTGLIMIIEIYRHIVGDKGGL